MAIELSIIQQRGTIFIPKFIAYSIEQAKNYSDLLQGAKPLPVPLPTPLGVQGVQQPDALQNGGIWQLVRGILRVVFYPNRVDIVKDWISPRHVKEEDEFLSLCSTIFSTILSREQVTASRVAYAPIFARDKDSSFSDKMMWDVIFKNPSFCDSLPNEVSVTRNYRVNQMLKEREITLNFRSTFGSANHALPDGTVSTGSVLVSFDINSIPDSDYRFDQEMLRCFFDSALLFSDKMYNYFIEEK